MNEHDVVVIGGGAAGLSAALVLARARRRVAVVDAGRPRNAPAAHMQGFLGSDGRPPAELLAAGRQEVAGYGGRLISGTVTGITPAATGRPGFDLTLADGSTLRTRRVLVTTGLRDDLPDLPGVRERWGRDLLHCPYCHGYEVRDQPLGVLGGSPEAVDHAHLIRQWSDDVVFFPNGTALTGDQRARLTARGIGIVDIPVARLVIEDDRLVGVGLDSGETVHRAAVFVRPRFVPNDSLLAALGCAAQDNGWVAVDSTGRTSVAGVWAAGNAVNPRAQVITAAGEGSAAAIAINNDLVAEDVAGVPSGTSPGPRAAAAGPPSKHQLALMIWIAVFPTLTVLNLTLGDWLAGLGPVLRTFVLATLAVPVVIYGLMPRLHRLRARILARRAA